MTKGNTKTGKYEMDMCNGPLLGKMVSFAVPLAFSGILQLLFNAADIAVAGKFVGNQALAAVGSTSSLINFIVNVFIGLSVGANVLVARFYGAGQKKELKDTVHTAITVAIISGILLIGIGCGVAEPALRLMGTPDDVIDLSLLYIRIYFCGMPAMMCYNFGSAILRAVGDTKRPLYFLTVSGVLNVVLNVFFVVVIQIGVAGVALATILSQALSALLVLRCLVKSEADYRLNLRELKVHRTYFAKMVGIGVPAGLQGALFSVSNMLIQSSVNSFGSDVMAGNTAASNLEGFTYTAMNSVHQTCLSFTGQNYGARKNRRIGKIMLYGLGIVTAIGLVMGIGTYMAGGILLQLYANDPEVIHIGVIRLGIIAAPYFLCGIMDVMTGMMRGMGYSVVPMFVSLTGACVFRVLWVTTIFRSIGTLESLYWSYPVSWILTFSAHLVCFTVLYLRLLKKDAALLKE